MAGRKLVVLADGHFDHHFGKTAVGIVKYRPSDVVAVVDAQMAGQTTQNAIGFGGDIPIVATLGEAVPLGADSLLIGVATRGGSIPSEWRPLILGAIASGLDIISGLHEFLADDDESARAAAEAGVRLVDVRKPPIELSVAAAHQHNPSSTVITIVGSDCAVGKMSVALDTQSCAMELGLNVGLVATGQTGMMITGKGVPLDRVIGDFMAGAVERLVLQEAAVHDLVLVEGQGSLLHPAYSGVTLALIHGSQPDGMILTVMPARTTIEDYDVDVPSVLDLIEIHEGAAAWIKAAPVIAVAVNSLGLSDEQSDRVIESLQVETGLPVTDTFRHGASALVEAMTQFHDGRLARLRQSGERR